MGKPQAHSFLVKTHGWLLNALSIATIQDMSHWYSWTANGRFAWAEYNKTELTGVAAQQKVVYPQGWSIQEIHPPDGYAEGIYQGTGPPPVAGSGMPLYIEIHDLWCSQPLTTQDLGIFAGVTNNTQAGPNWLGTIYTGDQSGTPYKDWEMVIAGRSRVWAPLAITQQARELGFVDVNVRQQFIQLIHDNTWGSGEPIASLELHHYRLMIANLDTSAINELASTNSTYCHIPASNQPMLAVLDKPPFLSRMTMERRSKGV